MPEDLFSVKSKKGMNRDLIMIIAVLIVGLLVIVFVVSKGILKDFVMTEDIITASAKDVSTYITSLSTVDAGMQIYALPGEMNVTVKSNFVQLSTNLITVSSEFSGNVKETSFTAKEICIVKKTINGEGQIYVCDVGNVECCKPIIK